METRRFSINTKRPEISVNICVASAAEKEYFAAVLNRSRALASYIGSVTPAVQSLDTVIL